MNFFEQEYRKRFSNQQLPANKLNSDELWASIETKLSPAPSRPKHWLSGRHRLGFALLLVLLATGIWVYQQTSANPADVTRSETYVQLGALPVSTTKQSEQAASANIGKTESTTQADGVTAQTESIPAEVAYSKPPNNYAESLQSIESEEFIQANTAIQPIHTPESPGPNGITQMPSLYFLPTVAGNIEQPQFAALFNVSDIELTPTRKSNNLSWQAGIFAGINTTLLRFNATDQAISSLKNESEDLLPGFSTGIHSTLIWKKRWVFNSGLEHHRLWSKLDYEQERTVQVFKENQLLEVRYDQTTGTVLSERFGDTTINALETRRVLHYNQYQLASIPLEVGFVRQSGKFQYGLTAGAVLNFRIAQSGKTIRSDGSITAFNSDDEGAPFPAMQIGVSASPFLRYALTDRWGINLRTQWRYAQNRIPETLRTHIHQFHLNAGLSYQL